MTNLSMSLVNILYNFRLLRLAGENGVAAYGVIMYACLLYTSHDLVQRIGAGLGFRQNSVQVFQLQAVTLQGDVYKRQGADTEAGEGEA